MNARVEPPPKRGMGCFGKGCLTFLVLVILLIVAGVGGSLWIFRNTYLSDKPEPIVETSAPNEGTSSSAGQTSPQPTKSPATVREDLKKLKSAARSHEKTDVELTAEDINALISANRKSRGTAFVRIDDNVASVQLSIPLKRLDVPFQNAFGLGDRYLNGNVSMLAPPGTNASTVQLSEVTINGHGLPSSLLDWGVPGVGRTLRSYVIKYANQYGITGGEIRDGKVILHTRGE